MRHVSLLFLAAGLAAAQTPFKANARLGVPAQIGSITTVAGSKERIEVGLLRELTLDSADLALTFATRTENIVAKTSEKLLILRGSLRNPEKTSTNILGPSAVISMRLWQAYKGQGAFAFVAHYDPDTLRAIHKDLKGGESAKFAGVWRVPLDFADFRIGAASDRPNIVAWYDLASSIGRIQSIFATADGLSANPSAKVNTGVKFEMDGLEFAPGGVSHPARIAGAAIDASKAFHVVTLNVTNRMLAPARWGWQYVIPELIGADGSVTKAYPDMIDQATDRSWGGDLKSGASVMTQLQFYPSGRATPKALRLTMIATGRSVEIALQ